MLKSKRFPKMSSIKQLESPKKLMKRESLKSQKTQSTRKIYFLLMLIRLSFMKKLLPKYFDSEWSFA